MADTLFAVTGSLLGVLLGAACTYLLTSRAQVSKALHESRIAAFARLAAALMEYRRALMERWYVANGSPASSTAEAGVHETRSAAWAALFEVQLLSRTARIGEQAREAVDATSQIKNSTDQSDLSRRADESRRLVEKFVDAARHDIAAGRRI